MIELSVIIPVYNVEKYLEECIESVLKQEIDNCEIICIEDCSTDNSYKILKGYEERYENIRIIKNKHNRGLSYARNLGIESAVGRYVLFLDSDDYLCDNMFSELKKNFDENIDIIGFNYNEYIENKGEFKASRVHSSIDYSGIFTGEDAFIQLEKNNDFIMAVWARIYRKDFLIKNNLKFIEGIYNEDVPYTFRAVLLANKIKLINKEYINYRIREQSITTSFQPEKHIKGSFYGYCDSLAFWREREYGAKINEAIQVYLDRHYLAYINKKISELGHDGITFDNIYTQFMWNHLKLELRTEFFNINKLSKYENIIIYGAGMLAKKLFKHLFDHNIGITGIAVSEVDGNQKFFTHIVKPIDLYKAYIEDGLIILAVSEKYHDDIYERLNTIGYKNVIKVNELYSQE